MALKNTKKKTTPTKAKPRRKGSKLLSSALPKKRVTDASRSAVRSSPVRPSSMRAPAEGAYAGRAQFERAIAEDAEVLRKQKFSTSAQAIKAIVKCIVARQGAEPKVRREMESWLFEFLTSDPGVMESVKPLISKRR